MVYKQKHIDSLISLLLDKRGGLYAYNYLDVTDDARSRVPKDSKEFKETFKHRQTVEQYFSRLDNREPEQKTHYGFTAISNQRTIAHLTASLIAVAAGIHLNQPGKIRCCQTFADPVRLRKTGWPIQIYA
jgi:hypothetical protein